jgi:hypothetical protein
MGAGQFPFSISFISSLFIFQDLMGFEMPNFCKADISLFWKEGEILAWPAQDDEDAEPQQALRGDNDQAPNEDQIAAEVTSLEMLCTD